MKRFLAAWALMLAIAAPAAAQFETATVVGTVRDSSGALVPDATVTLLNVLTGVSAERQSDGNGSFEFFTVRIGSYLVTAEKEGFQVALVDGVQVTVGARLRVAGRVLRQPVGPLVGVVPRVSAHQHRAHA
ncbi:MAG: carboxypeptidase-like regulatory domain-containing protein, partial [Vicinamibacteria bacterium]